MVSSIVITLTIILVVLFIILPLRLNRLAKEEIVELINIKSEIAIANNSEENNISTDNDNENIENSTDEQVEDKGEGASTSISVDNEVNNITVNKDKIVDLNNEINTGSIFTDSALSQLAKEQKELFNQKFVVYETKDNDSASFASVSTMFSDVASNNDINENRKVDINGVIINSDNIDAVKSCLNKNLKFKINCIYDNKGYVKTIELRDVQNSEE